MKECPGCGGGGAIGMGDYEYAVWEICPTCGGEGEIEDCDTFVPERDAWTAND